MKIYKEFLFVNQILDIYKNQIGNLFSGYKNHVYRMLHFCLEFHNCSEDDFKKLQIAGAFHDIGIWTNQTVDYLPPSILLAKKYLKDNGLSSWEEEISIMIDMHHKITSYSDNRYPLVEVFRKGDLTDFSLGLIRNGIEKSVIQEVKNAFPNEGFHKFLCILGTKWVLKHPFNPAPIIKW